MTKKKTESEKVVEELAHEERIAAIEAQYAKLPTDQREEAPEPAQKQAAAALEKARRILNDLGHFESNKAVALIDEALEWVKKCEQYK